MKQSSFLIMIETADGSNSYTQINTNGAHREAEDSFAAGFTWSSGWENNGDALEYEQKEEFVNNVLR